MEQWSRGFGYFERAAQLERFKLWGQGQFCNFDFPNNDGYHSEAKEILRRQFRAIGGCPDVTRVYPTIGQGLPRYQHNTMRGAGSDGDNDARSDHRTMPHCSLGTIQINRTYPSIEKNAQLKSTTLEPTGGQRIQDDRRLPNLQAW